MPFIDMEKREAHEVAPGCTAKFVHSANMTVAHFDLTRNAVVPPHAHEHEQICTVISGQLELTIEGETRVLEAGGSAVIPPYAVHSGRAISPCRVLDTFHPVREDFLALSGSNSDQPEG
jgi:quercetin dioxygenase-like cupin family protein